MGVQAPVCARPAAAWRPLYSVLGDERLAGLVTEGNKQAFAPLYERYYQQLYRYCRSIVHDDVDAQDALQSTFASAFAALRKGQRDAPLRPWLFRIAHNEAVSVIRRRRPTEELSEASEHCGDSVEELAGERTRFALLLRDLGELPERQRSALVMRELSGLSHEEIATVLRTSVGAAKQTIFEARRSLSEFAEGRVMDCDEIRKMVSDADGRTLRSRRLRAHLSDCSPCAEFAAAIATRTAALRALSPTLPATAAAALLGRALGAGSGHGGGGGAAGLAAGTAGKTATAALATKAVAGVVIVAATTAGAAAGLGEITEGSHRAPARRAASSASVRSATRPVAPAQTTNPTTERAPAATGTAANPRDHRGAPAAAGAKVTRLAKVTLPTARRGGSKSASGAATAGSTPGAPTPAQHSTPSAGAQVPATHGSGGGAGHPASGGGQGVTVSAPGGAATVSASGGTATVTAPAASATVSVPSGSATVSVPGASASVSVPNGTTASIGSGPTLHLPGLGSVLGPLTGASPQPD